MNTDHLYSLLPAIYRLRDAERGYPLQALLRVIEEQVNIVEQDIASLYDNWFIETCDDWVVPYIGDLLGVSLLQQPSAQGLTPRAFIANTLASRRRKGTAGMLERVAQDISGWPAAVVEYFQQLATTQNINHLRF